MEQLRIREIAFTDHLELRSYIAASAHAARPLASLLEEAIFVHLILATGVISRLRVGEITCDGTTTGWITYVVEPSTLACSVGPLTVLRKATDRIRLYGDSALVLGEGVLCEGAPAELTARVLADAFQPLLRARPMVAQAVATAGLVAKFAELCAGTGRRALLMGDAAPRYSIDPVMEFEQHLASLSKSSRQTFRYSIRRLSQEMDGQMECRAFRETGDVEAFISDATAISRNTYQWSALGLGLKNQAAIQRRCRSMAELGGFRSYILYCRAAPVAFIEGYKIGGVFFTYSIGYLPEWSRLSAGTVCVLEALRDVMTADGSVRRVDFMEGAYDYKRRLSNTDVQTLTLTVLPGTVHWRVFGSVHRAADVTHRLLARLKPAAAQLRAQLRAWSFRTRASD